MLLNSDSQQNPNSSKKQPFRRFSNKTKFKSFMNYSIKPNKKINKFYSMSLSKSNGKNTNHNPRINIIINNNNPINYTTSSSSMFINSFSGDKSLMKNKNNEVNSTFVFTGDNQTSIDNGQIIENYLKNPIFECKSLSTISKKDQTELIPSQEKSFFLCSSLSSNTLNTVSTLPRKNKDKNLIKMLKLINSESGNKKNQIKSKDNIEGKKIQRFDNYDSTLIKDKGKRKNCIYFFMLFILNAFIIFKVLIILFQPSANKLFYDNDHNDYIYTISLLSKEKSIVINEGK